MWFRARIIGRMGAVGLETPGTATLCLCALPRANPAAAIGRPGQAAAGLGGEQRPGRDDVAFEFMLNALRLTEGVPAILFSERTGLDPACMQKPLTRAVARGLLEPGLEHIRPTPLGRRFLNELVALFLPEATR